MSLSAELKGRPMRTVERAWASGCARGASRLARIGCGHTVRLGPPSARVPVKVHCVFCPREVKVKRLMTRPLAKVQALRFAADAVATLVDERTVFEVYRHQKDRDYVEAELHDIAARLKLRAERLAGKHETKGDEDAKQEATEAQGSVPPSDGSHAARGGRLADGVAAVGVAAAEEIGDRLEEGEAT